MKILTIFQLITILLTICSCAHKDDNYLRPKNETKASFVGTSIIGKIKSEKTDKFINYRSISSENGDEPEVKKFTYHGLEDLDINALDIWAMGLTRGAKSETLSNTFMESIRRAFVVSATVNDFYKKILGLGLHIQYTKKENYYNLANGLLATKKLFRHYFGKKDEKLVRSAITLVQLLAEETLYVLNFKFPDVVNYKAGYNNQTAAFCDNKFVRFENTNICQGDILLSKGGAGSSSFIARIPDFPGNFSHAALAYVYVDEKDSNKKTLYSPEAFIEDGVKLRRVVEGYSNENKRSKLFIYRAKSNRVAIEASKQADLFVEQMKKNINTTNVEDLETTASYPYDFAMDSSDQKAFFCSEVPFYVYNNAINGRKFIKDENPYTTTYWSSIKDPINKNFMTNFLFVQDNYPAPSDIELNPNFEIIAMHFDLLRLKKDRKLVAALDALISAIHDNDQMLKVLIEAFKVSENKPVTPELAKQYLKILQTDFNFQVTPDQEAYVEKIPKGVGINQLLFFAFLDGAMVPRVLDAVDAYEEELKEKGEPVSLNTLRHISYYTIQSILQEYTVMVQEEMSRRNMTFNDLMTKVMDFKKILNSN